VLLLGAERMTPGLPKNAPLIVVVNQTVSCTISSVRIDAEHGLVLDAVCD
jgi:hypothetical protein